MSSRAAFWARHLAAIQAEGISTQAYARREGLSAGSLYVWRGKLKACAEGRSATTPIPAPPAAFMALAVAEPAPAAMRCTLVLASGLQLELSALPEPLWVADLCQAMRTGEA